MTNTEFLNSKIREIAANQEINESNDFSVINVRPGDKIAAMLDIFTILNGGKLPLLSLSDGISEQLANFLMSNKDHIKIITDNLPDYADVSKSNNAINILINKDCINYYGSI